MNKISTPLKAIAVILFALFSWIGYDYFYHWDRMGRSSYKYDDYLKFTNDKNNLIQGFTLPKSIHGLYKITVVDSIVEKRWGYAPYEYRNLDNTETDFNITIQSDNFRFYENFCKIQKGQLIKGVSADDLYHLIVVCSEKPNSDVKPYEYEFFIESSVNRDGKFITIHQKRYRPWYAIQIRENKNFKKYISDYDFTREIENNEKNKTPFMSFCEQLPVIERVSSFFGRARISSVCSCGFDQARNTLTVTEMTKALSPSAGTIDPEVAKFSLESQLAIASCIEQLDVPADKKDLTKDIANLLRSQVAMQKEISKLK